MTVGGTGARYYSRRAPRPELLKPDRLDEHVWVAVAAFRVSPESLRGAAAESVHLDRENLATVDVGCYVCEQPWSERLSYRKCPGDPARFGPPQRPETD